MQDQATSDSAGNCSIGLITYLPDGTVVQWSAEASRLFGYSPEAAVGRNVTEFMSPIGCLRTPDAVLRPGDEPRFLYFIRRLDGAPVLLDAVLRRVVSAEGVLSKFDLRIRTPDQEPSPGGVELALSHYLETSPDAALLVGEDGRIVALNGRAERLSGYSRADLEGRGVETLVPESLRRVHERKRAEFGARPAARPMGTGLDLALRRKDGSAVPVDISLEPIRTASGLLVLAALRDMTPRKRAEERFVTMIEDAPDAMVVADAEGRIVLVNRQTEILFGYDREELLGQPIEILVPEPLRAWHRERRSAYLRAPVPRAMGERPILHGRRKDGMEIAIDIALSPIRTGDGLLVMAALRDASTRERLEEAQRRARDLEASSLLAQRASQLRGEFISGLSHELRTPLTSIIGYAELLKGEPDVPFQGDPIPCLDGILSAAHHLSGLVADVLDLAAIEAGKMAYRLEPVDLGAVVEDVRAVMWQPAQSRRVKFSVHVSPDLPEVVTDPGRLRQILLNLVSNAIKFTPPEGRVDLRIGPEAQGRFRIEVEDTGPGIAPEDVGRLFTPFERVGARERDRPAGTGLGLALTRRIAEGLGGAVGVRSQLGRGSVFWVVLPCVGVARPTTT